MMDICKMNLVELKNALNNKKITSCDIVIALKKEYEKDEKSPIPLHGFLEFFEDAELEAKKKR